jgi:DNA-binding LacI/PurR family transcriptional regulator
MRDAAFGMPAVVLDGGSFADKAVDYLASRGRKRLAIISAASAMAQQLVTSVVRAATSRGMTVQPYWTHAVAVPAAEWSRNLVHLMCMLPKEKQPDSMFITDDNLVPHATAGLLAGGISVPGDMDVVGHANFPWLTPSVVPAKRLGFDARQVLAMCIESVDKQRKKVACDAVTTVPARLDVEFEGALT